MNENCPSCGVALARPDGFFLGSIYVNYGVTGAIVAIGYPLALFVGNFNERWLMVGSLAFVVIFPLCFFRIARSVWMAIDRFFDPVATPRS